MITTALLGDKQVLLLGGAENGLNFEIEYIDQQGESQEALYAVDIEHADKAIKNATIQTTSIMAQEEHLVFKLDSLEYRILLPGGCKELLAFRRPIALGGDDLVGQFIRGK